MNMAKMHKAVQQYNRVGVSSSVEAASPHRLIEMLMNGALEKIAFAKGFMERGNIAEKGGHISWAISIVEGLRASLDLETGGEIAQNLDDLYDYMTRRLARANVEDNPDILDEVASLMSSVKNAWEQVPEELGEQGMKQHTAQVMSQGTARQLITMNKNIRYLLPKHYANVVLRLSQKIAVLAEQHEWQSARKLEAERHDAMQELFSHPDINDALPSMTSILHEVMQLDAEVIIKGESELQEMSLQLNELGKGKRAVNAYLKT